MYITQDESAAPAPPAGDSPDQVAGLPGSSPMCPGVWSSCFTGGTIERVKDCCNIDVSHAFDMYMPQCVHDVMCLDYSMSYRLSRSDAAVTSRSSNRRISSRTYHRYRRRCWTRWMCYRHRHVQSPHYPVYGAGSLTDRVSYGMWHTTS